MQVGIGLPNAIPDADLALELRWAEQADAGPFSSIGVVDRPRYDSREPMALLGAAAAVTERVTLATMVLIAPLRSAAVLAQQAATIDAVSGGRLVLGLGLGARLDDYEMTGIAPAHRGRRFSEMLGSMRDAWGAPRHDQALRSRPTVLIGGTDDAAVSRTARYGDGYVHGGGPPKVFGRAADRIRAGWWESGRPGNPLLWAQGYFALGDTATIERGRSYMRDYYGFTGAFVDKIVEQLLTTPQQVLAFAKGYADEGCDEMILFPAVAELDQIARLGDALSAL